MVKLCLHCGNTTKMEKVASYKWREECNDWDLWEVNEINMYMCPVCKDVTIEKEYIFSEDLVYTRDEYGNIFEDEKESTKIFQLYPSHTVTGDHIPKKIASAFESAIKVRNIDGAICAIAIRRTLEMMCKDKSSIEGNLYKMLESLANEGILPPILDNMASILRKLGNDAAHANEIEFDREKVNLLVHFTKTILDYVYNLPAQLENLQTKLGNSDTLAS